MQDVELVAVGSGAEEPQDISKPVEVSPVRLDGVDTEELWWLVAATTWQPGHVMSSWPKAACGCLNDLCNLCSQQSRTLAVSGMGRQISLAEKLKANPTLVWRSGQVVWGKPSLLWVKNQECGKFHRGFFDCPSLVWTLLSPSF